MSAAEPQEPDDRPLFLRELRPRKHRAGPTGPPPPIPAAEVGGYAAKAMEDEVTLLAATEQGRRNDQLNIAAFNLGQLVGAGLLDYGHVWSALHSTALHIGLEPGETVNTMRSGLHRGMEQPRQVPELVRDPVPDATVYTPTQDGAEGVAGEPPSIGERFKVLDWHELWADDTRDEWVVEPLLPARRLVALFSAPKVGKSLFMLDLAVAVARGLPFLGQTPERPRVVLYVDFENDPRGDVRTRLQAMGVGPDHLGNLRYLSYPQLAKLDTYVGGLELLAVAQHYEAEVVVIDTISRAVGGEENDNDTWLAFYRNTGQQLKAAGITCIRLDHTGKDETRGMRGGSAKYGDVDAVWAMTKVGDTTLRLECTANRLPIMEKVLVLDRHLSPLRHVVNPQGMAAAIAAQVPGLVAALDAGEFPVVRGAGAGVNKAYEWLVGQGVACTRIAAREAQEQRIRRASEDQQIDGTDPRFKDD